MKHHRLHSLPSLFVGHWPLGPTLATPIAVLCPGRGLKPERGENRPEVTRAMQEPGNRNQTWLSSQSLGNVLHANSLPKSLEEVWTHSSRILKSLASTLQPQEGPGPCRPLPEPGEAGGGQQRAGPPPEPSCPCPPRPVPKASVPLRKSFLRALPVTCRGPQDHL